MTENAQSVGKAGDHRFAVVIPTYNHGGRVAAVAREALALGWPVFVVDDGSTDDTAEKLRTVAGLHVIRHAVNRGKGAALISGMRRAAKMADYAIAMDADGQHDPADARRLAAAAAINRRVIVVGQREMADAPWTSRKGRAFSNFWVWISGGPKLADSQSGFRIYPLPETLDLGVVSRRYQFEVEVLARAAWQGIGVVEVPISARYGADLPRISHFHPFVDFLRNFGAFSRLITRRVFTPALWRTGSRRETSSRGQGASYRIL
ncbi:glycosyltransferase family 2 protein [uncultured Desulfosarcina sp.]|uniref:glycosyltransferase family 2 protein n=1 Tax=uncultured Desulfosarcina sp. TaxID=218289 RepID=UPI0029C70F08|nr:glycosyltransferase family 2 protein [uncultured Desulfosarcina sp.]